MNFDVGDLAVFASSHGGDYNGFLELLVKSRILPFYESSKIDIYRSDCESNAYGWDPEVNRIFQEFMDSYQIDEFTLFE